jgi:hypothetical protein
VTKRAARDPIYRGRRFSAETIELCVRWYITYRLSYRDLAAMLAERGLILSHTTIMRWVMRYVPEYEARWARFARSPRSSWLLKWTSLAGPANAWTCVLLLDGADHPCFNALARGWTISMELTDARTLQSVIKANGATDMEASYTVSADGRSMVRAQGSASGGIINTVYVRQ